MKALGVLENPDYVEKPNGAEESKSTVDPGGKGENYDKIDNREDWEGVANEALDGVVIVVVIGGDESKYIVGDKNKGADNIDCHQGPGCAIVKNKGDKANEGSDDHGAVVVFAGFVVFG